MTRALVAAALLLSPFSLLAQNPPQSSATSVVLSANQPPNATFAGGCPVAMSARQGIWDHTIRVRNGEKRQEGFGQRISLTLVDIHSAQIVAATVKVLGLSGKNRILNTDSSPNGSPDTSRVIQLTSFTGTKNGATAELYATGFTSVTSIQLLEVRYANGSAWSSPGSAVCRVAPDPFMLVATH